MSRSHEMATATFAMERVKDAQARFSSRDRDWDDYRSKAKAAPAVVMENGLLQTLAFYQEKGGRDKPEGILATHIGEWLVQGKFIRDPGAGMVEELMKLPTNHYRQATAETLSLLSWIKRLAAGQHAMRRGREG